MFAKLSKIFFLIAMICGVSECLNAQTDAGKRPTLDGREDKNDEVRTVQGMLAKQRAIQDKKDHQELLKRGEQAAALSEQLENAFEQKNELSLQDRQKLDSLEKIVTKIRRELGGDDDGEEAVYEGDKKPSTAREAFNILKTTTVKLFDELKKTTRFSISVIAIQNSNSVLRLVKFLRLRS